MTYTQQPQVRLGAGPTAPAPEVQPQASGSFRARAALSRSRSWARPASTGARLIAYTLDTVTVFIVAGVVGLLTRSVALGVILLIELAVILVVIEARTGLTLGNFLLRIRTTRDDAPFSPGIGRSALRALVQGLGSLVALVGGWIVVATSAADPMRAGRSIADRAGRTLVVKVPSAVERDEWARNAATWAASAPQPAAALQQAVGQISPEPRPVQPVSGFEALFQQPVALQQPVLSAQSPYAGAPLQAPEAPQHAQPYPGGLAGQVSPVAPAAAGPAVPAQPQLPPNAVANHTDTTPPAVAYAAALPEGVVSIEAPVAAPPPVRNVEYGEQLLMSFDTGQRAQLPTPVSVNLGRKPDRIEEDDQLLVVTDPDSSVSKTHLRLEYRGGSVWLTDQGSTNGTEIFDESGEGTLLEAGARVRLEEGSSVRIGNRSFTVATVLGENPR